jgi:hypothetical protein
MRDHRIDGATFGLIEKGNLRAKRRGFARHGDLLG